MRRRGALAGWLAAVLALAGPAGAEVRVYLLDRTEPIVTAEVFEEGPWLFYREGESPYLFAVARNRVERLEIVRDAVVQTIQITPPGQAVFPDFRREVILNIATLQNQRVEELGKLLDEEMAKIGAAAAAVNQAREAAGDVATVEARLTLDVQRARAASLLVEYNRARERLDRSLEVAAKFRMPGPEPRYYFHR